MTFSCKNFDHDSGCCRKLGGECVPGRPGCVLDGQVVLSDELKERLRQFEQERGSREKEK
ncbi:MAG: hypothetical protein Kow00100_24210 [Geothermobacteraceae bacterium]